MLQADLNIGPLRLASVCYSRPGPHLELSGSMTPCPYNPVYVHLCTVLTEQVEAMSPCPPLYHRLQPVSSVVLAAGLWCVSLLLLRTLVLA